MVIFPIANSDNTLEEAISERNSIIDILRLVYAIVVIFGHSFALSRSPAGFSDPVMNLIGFDYSSALAVDGFFLLSGILVSQSWVRNPSLGAFVLSRALRVWPGLIFCLLVTIFLFLPLSKEAVSSKYSYISHIFDPAIASYFINNTLFGSQEFKVSGYFVDSKYGINGSLWSLRGEIIMYIFVGILGFLGLYKKGLEILATIIVVLIASIFLMHDKVFPIIGYNGQFVAPVLFFCAGMLLYILRSLIRVGLIHVIFILFLYLMTDGYISKVAFYVFFMAGNVMLIGLDQKIKTLKMGGDLSYGIYLYGFPIQHLIGQYFHQANPYQHFMLSITFVLPFAWISWRFIEKPSIFASKTLLNKLLIFFEVIVRWAKDNKPYQQTSICAKNFVYPLLMLVLLFANTIFFHYIYLSLIHISEPTR